MTNRYVSSLSIEDIKLIHSRTQTEYDKFFSWEENRNAMSEEEKQTYWRICLHGAIRSFEIGSLKKAGDLDD